VNDDHRPLYAMAAEATAATQLRAENAALRAKLAHMEAANKIGATISQERADDAAFPGQSGLRVETQVQPDERIVQTVSTITDGVREQVLREVINTREAAVRRALVALGWTPPRPSLPT
jgi:hypothetical protein